MNLKSIIKKSVLASMLAITTAAFGQKDILLYSTDFTDWTALDGTSGSSDDVFPGGGAGTGFTIGDKPQVSPTGTIGGATGYLAITNGPNTGLLSKELDFVAGGVVEIEFVNKTGSNSRWVGVDGADAVLIETLEPTDGRYDRAHVGKLSGTNYTAGTALGDKNGPDASLYGTWISGFNGVDNNGKGVTKVSFRLPSTYAGTKRVKIVMHKDIALTSLKIFTAVGTTPYVCSPDYPNAKEDGSGASTGLILQGTVGGSQVNGNVAIKGYNLTGDVTFSVVGQDAAKFSLGATTMSAADALAGTNSVAVNFMPSVKSGSSSAMLKISSGTNDYYVNLVGVSGSTDPQIVANTAPLNFWTYQTGKFSQLLNVSGMNLNGPVTAKLEGEGAINFSLSTSEISAYDAAKGFVLNITFTGDINEGTKTANLVLSSPGAPSVSIPLSGITSIVKPETFTVDFSVSPAGSGYIDLNPGGRVFKKGTVVKASVTPETGYSIASWSDNAGSRRAERTFTISETTPQSIVVNLTKGGSGGGGGETAATSSFVAMPATNVTANSMTANWSAASSSDATVAVTYTVTLYDANGNQIDQQAGLTTTTADFSGLTPNTAYTYKVTSTSTDAGQTETTRVGPFYTVDDTVYVCGE